MEESRSTWILSGPVCLSMLANAFFLVNIVRVLVTKLKAPSTSSYGMTHQRQNSTRVEMPADHDHDQHRVDESGSRVNGRIASPGAHGAAHRPSHSLNGLRKAVR